MKLINIIIIIVITVIFSPPVSAQSKSLESVNQSVCDRFEQDVSKLAAIMEELRTREGITETRVAFGGSDTPIKTADYWVNYAAEAIAFQRVQKYSSQANLRSSLNTLVGKIIKAKNAVGQALNEK